MKSKRRHISDCISEFNLAMYQQGASDNPSANMFLSPTCISIVMLMVYIGARNRSEDQMAKALKLEGTDKHHVLEDVHKLVEKLKTASNNTVQTANSLFPHCDKIIFDSFISTVRKYFQSEIKSMDFTTAPEKSRVTINEWVEKETNNKIKEILPEGSLTPLTSLVIVNAIYFKANWEIPFEPRCTEIKTFITLNSDKVKVKMMRAKKMEDIDFYRSRSLNCKVLKLKYENTHIAMLVVLPNETDGLPKLESEMDLKTLKELISKLSTKDVEVSLPKFKMETTTQLKPLLSKLGMVDIFDEELADLSGTGKDLYVSEVYHKTFIDVNEEGTEAGAATAAVEVSRSLDEMASFKADHPFMFIIWHDDLNIPLFIGRLVTPEIVEEDSSSHHSHSDHSNRNHRRRRQRSRSYDRYTRRRNDSSSDDDRHGYRKRRR
ncbi:leukocyte elastase inhibitor-like [Ruditapes philippinarum]|uniref:leukocyte elastase inhibitor-like n=1 Tax=Ruditapes philippinarum TaxID=129788 RepID=UPI00295B5214|nr:leukocyte elastase inhibitor-like [Ruditapes philippinarum]